MTSAAKGPPYPLGDVALHTVLRRTSAGPPLSLGMATGDPSSVHTSPVASWVSVGSLDEIISLEDRTDEQKELDKLIYRLCNSLHLVATNKSAKMHHGAAGNSGALVGDDAKRFHNMRGHEDWCPLRHLFDSSSYYRAVRRASNPQMECRCHDEARGVSSDDPVEMSQWLLDELHVTRLSGGNSNHVYRLSHSLYPEKTILLRVYGDRGGEVIDRERDTKAMQIMSKAKMGPALLHSFHWGRVEEFVEGAYTCTTDMLLASPSLLSAIYEGLCGMHQLDATPFLPENMESAKPLGGGVIRLKSAEELASLVDGKDDYYSSLACEKALENVCPTSFERSSFRLLRLMSPHVVEAHRRSLVDWLSGEIMFVRSEIQSRDIPVVFSHNDLNPGNILLSRRLVPAAFRKGDDDTGGDGAATEEGGGGGKSKSLVERRGYLFIDFEYTDANYRCFDLGNTLCEMDYDYTRGTEAGGRGFIKFLHEFPPDAKAAAWRDLGEEYPRLPELIVDAWRRGGADGNVADVGSAALQAVRRYFATRDGVQDSEVSLSQAQLVELLLGMLAAHLQWTLWSLVMGCTPDECADCATDTEAFALGGSGLDYVRYGECRLQEYIALRRWLISNGLI